MLILDEIQESKAVYERIRVFRNILNCDVIVTGSYLGGLKNAFQPLGDIYKLQLYPLSYQEYLYYYDGYSYYCDHKKVRKVTELHVDSKKPENGSFDVSMFLSILAGMLGLGVVTLFVTRRKKK